MDKKVTSIVAYAGILCGALGIMPNLGKLVGILLPLIVWFVAYFIGDKSGAKMHLNQSLVLIIIGLVGSIIGIIPLIGTIVNAVIWVITLILGILGLIAAIKGENKALPIIGGIKILK